MRRQAKGSSKVLPVQLCLVLTAHRFRLLLQTIAALPAAVKRLLLLLRRQPQPGQRRDAADRDGQQPSGPRTAASIALHGLELPNGLRIVCGSPIEARIWDIGIS